MQPSIIPLLCNRFQLTWANFVTLVREKSTKRYKKIKFSTKIYDRGTSIKVACVFAPAGRHD